MTTRAHRPTDKAAGYCGTDGHGGPGGSQIAPDTAPSEASVAAAAFESFEGDPTEVSERAGATLIDSAPTYLDMARPERSEPIRMISMKPRSDTDRPRDEMRAPPRVRLRSLAEVSGDHAPVDLGHLAPPRDPRKVRIQQVRRQWTRAGITVVLAIAVALAIWLAVAH
jgi:hypothetical protein